MRVSSSRGLKEMSEFGASFEALGLVCQCTTCQFSNLVASLMLNPAEQHIEFTAMNVTPVEPSDPAFYLKTSIPPIAASTVHQGLTLLVDSLKVHVKKLSVTSSDNCIEIVEFKSISLGRRIDVSCQW